MNQEQPARSPIVEMKNLTEGMKFTIKCVIQLHIESADDETTTEGGRGVLYIQDMTDLFLHL